MPGYDYKLFASLGCLRWDDYFMDSNAQSHASSHCCFSAKKSNSNIFEQSLAAKKAPYSARQLRVIFCQEKQFKYV